MDAGTDTDAAETSTSTPAAEAVAGEGGGSEEAKVESEDEALLTRAQNLIFKIWEVRANPNPRHLHTLASILETEESRFLKETGNSSLNTTARSSHSIGRLGHLVREKNEAFYELISSKILSESRFSISVRAAAARVLLSCSTTSTYPHVFDDDVVDNIKTWVMEDSVKVSPDDCDWKRELGGDKPTDSEMLRTYATGLLAISLTGASQVIEDALKKEVGLPRKLMRYLRTRILGDVTVGQKDASFPTDSKHSNTPLRGREESRGRSLQVLDASRLDGVRPGDEGLSGEQDGARERNMSIRQGHGEEPRVDGGESLKSELVDSLSHVVGMHEMIDEDDDLAHDGRNTMDLIDGRSKYGEWSVVGRATRDEIADESVRDDSSRRRVNRCWSRSRGKSIRSEGTLENERPLMSPPGLQLAGVRECRDRNQGRNDDVKRLMDSKSNSGRTCDDVSTTKEDSDERFRGCTVGSRDISEIVEKATRAAEAEARTANAPEEAIKAAGDAAAELVKSSAFEAWKNMNDEEAAVEAASKAASTVVDAAKAVEVSRNTSIVSNDLMGSKMVKSDIDEKLEELFILDKEPLARLREKYCIQSLEILGEYVEALGPVLGERGVEVCITLLEQCLKGEDSIEQLTLLPEVLKLIFVLAAHKKFAAGFIDKNGIQGLLSVPRIPQTFFGLSSCLYTIGSLQGIMERVCALPSDTVLKVVELALQLLECPQDQARKNAALFLGFAFVFRAILDAFDAQEGLQKTLNVLHGAASVRSGGNSGALGIPNGTLRNDGSPAEVLTASEKQIAYHTCVALRQYFRAHLLLLVDSLRPNKNSRTTVRRAANKPLDISNEAMDAVFLQIQRDRKLGSAFARVRWPAVDKFLASNGHTTMLELCQAPPGERYLHELGQFALGILHIVTFVPLGRKLVVNASLSNGRVGMAVILDAANSFGYMDAELIHAALNVLVNLVCPPPSISNKPSASAQGQQSVSVVNDAATEIRERNPERNIADRTVPLLTQNDNRERIGEGNMGDRGAPFTGGNSQIAVSGVSSGVVGERRISLGPGTGSAGLAAQMENVYHLAREAVRANNGIKVLLHLLHPRMITPPQALDCLRALACRVLLGLARDHTITHILTKLQVGKKLSELIRDSGSQAAGAEQGRWQAELTQVAIELIAIVTNSGRASTLAATDAAAPTLRRIERAAIAAATPITYHSRELLLLVHEHLQASGLTATAALLQKEADLTPLPPLSAPQPPLHQTSLLESSTMQLPWPSGRVSSGFLSDNAKPSSVDESAGAKSDSNFSSRRKPLVFTKSQLHSPASLHYKTSALKSPSVSNRGSEDTSSLSDAKSNVDIEPPLKTPLLLPMKRKFLDIKDPNSLSSKRLATAELVPQSPVFQTPNIVRRANLQVDTTGLSPAANATPRDPGRTASVLFEHNSDEHLYQSTPGAPVTPFSQLTNPADAQPGNAERMTLDSLVVQYLKHQHRQCPAPITTLPPLSLLHPHVCPEPSRSLNAPINVTARVSTREFSKHYGGIHAHRRDRQFVYSRFRPCRTCRDDAALLTCITFLGDSFRIATGSHSGELKVFDLNDGSVLESHLCHQSPVSIIQSAFSGDTQMILSSSSYDVKLWDASSVSAGPLHSFDGCKAACFSPSGTMFAALSTEASHRDVLLYDIQTQNVEFRLPESSSGPSAPGRGHVQSLIHFSPCDTKLLWNGTLWDYRSARPIHRFDQFTDYGGGGFHPARNEVIINSEVWDLRKYKLLRNVPSLDQTVITFNSSGDVIYAILRRNLEDITSAVNTRRVRQPLFAAFRTIDAISYTDIATVPVDRCVLDFSVDPTDSYVGVVAMDDHEEMFSSARLYEIGRRRSTDDDSDPDDGPDTEDEDDEEDDENDDDEDVDDSMLGDLEDVDDIDSDDLSNEDEDGDSGDELDGDGEFMDGGHGILEIMAEGEDGEDDDDSEVLEDFSSGAEEDFDYGF